MRTMVEEKKGKSVEEALADGGIPAASKTENTKKNPGKSKPAAARGRGWSFIAILFSLTALGVSAYLAWRVEFSLVPQITAKEQENVVLNSRIESLRQENMRLAAMLEEHSSEFQKFKEIAVESDIDIHARMDQLASSISAAYTELDEGATRLYVEEVIQLISLGDQRLHITGDVKTAISVRQLADRQLEQMADPRFSKVRSALAEEVRLLNQVSSIDETDISLKLLGYADSLDKLPFRVEHLASGGDTAETATSDTDSNSEGLWQEIWSDLSSLVIVTRTSDYYAPALSDGQKILVVENIRAHLLGAQAALTQGNAQIYRTHLVAAIERSELYFSPFAGIVSNFIEDLVQLADVPVGEVVIPDVSDSLRLLKRIQSNG